jgi:signal transduction histidine kinase
LAEGAKAPLRLLAAPDERFSSAAETAAYLLVAEAAKVGAVSVTVVRGDERLVVEVDAVTQPGGLADLEDRIGALDGTLETSGTLGGGVHMRAEIPCG